jgi:prepilin-type N-terminal cleavage/methylation domain-containing protein
MVNIPVSRYRRQHRSARGFTIIELMIATAAFSVIILVITVSVLQFSKEYYKGLIASSTQSAARTLMDDVTRSLEFDSGNFAPLGTTGYCLGGAKRYSFALDKEVTETAPNAGDDQTSHGLVSDSVTGCSSSTAPLNVKNLPANLASVTPTLSDPTELLGQHMRLAIFSIKPDSSGVAYTIDIKVVYGDDDLLTSPTSANMACKSTAGSQFCAVSELITTVTKRVN